MKMLSSEITKLLDKLYNLRGEDSVVLAKMEEEKKAAENTKERTSEEKTNLQERISTLDEEERVLGEEGEKLVNALKGIKTDDFKIVLEKLNINFNPDKLSEQVSNELPKTIEKVQSEKESAKKTLVKVESEMNTAIATIEELALRKDEAISNQARLNEYFDLALNGNINITRDSITSLLEKFDFSENEQREAAKILMFPEDALYEYESKKKNVEEPGKSISEVFQEAKENIDDLFSHEDINEKVVSPKEELINLLTELGFDYLEFTTNDLEKILANYNESILRKNVMFAKGNSINLDLFVDNAELLYDKEFELKIRKLMEVGKEANDIYLNPSVLRKCNMDSLNSIIDSLLSNGFDPKNVPLFAYETALKEKLALLSLDEKEKDKVKGKFWATLSLNTVEELKERINYLKDKNVNIIKANSIKVLNIPIEELAKRFSILEEIHETDLYKVEPLALSFNVIDIYKKIKYCKQNGISYRSSEGKYESFLFNENEWEKKLNNNVLVNNEPKNVENLNVSVSEPTFDNLFVNDESNVTPFNSEKELNNIETKVSQFENIKDELEKELESLNDEGYNNEPTFDNNIISFADINPDTYDFGYGRRTA